MKLSNKFFALSILAQLASCSEVQDRPLPASTQNAEDLLLIVQDKLYSYEPSPGQSEDMVRLAIYKSSIEEELGYSFDKTFRFAHLFSRESGDMASVMAPIMLAIRNDAQSALDNGYISARTFEILQAEQNAKFSIVSNKQEEFLSYISECEQRNGGICTSSLFVDILLESDASRRIFENIENIADELSTLQVELASAFDAFEMGSNGWVVTPAGEEINTCCLLEADYSGADKEFVINSEQLAFSRAYTQLIEEEKIGLSN